MSEVLSRIRSSAREMKNQQNILSTKGNELLVFRQWLIKYFEF